MRNSFQTVLLSVICLFGLLNIACPFTKSDNPDVRPIGPTVNADLLIYFNSGTSQDEINAFSKKALARPDQEGQGEDLPPGVRTFLRLRAVEGHDGIAITFFPNASEQQREELKRSIKESLLVYRVLENTTPDSVKTLE
jgi:hypothetical protein